MQQSDIGREIVVIITDTETIKGIVVSVTDDYIFEVQDSFGNLSTWNVKNITGYKWKGSR